MQVVTRGELRGPGGLRAGIDVRGDGDAQAYTGRIRRQLIDVFPREDAYQALRRMLIEEQALALRRRAGRPARPRRTRA